jgi:hypothetical protein
VKTVKTTRLSSMSQKSSVDKLPGATKRRGSQRISSPTSMLRGATESPQRVLPLPLHLNARFVSRNAHLRKCPSICHGGTGHGEGVVLAAVRRPVWRQVQASRIRAAQTGNRQGNGRGRSLRPRTTGRHGCLHRLERLRAGADVLPDPPTTRHSSTAPNSSGWTRQSDRRRGAKSVRPAARWASMGG